MNDATPKPEISIQDLKNCLDALEKLKAIRRELKARLAKEGLTDDEEVGFSEQLTQLSKQVKLLEGLKLHRVPSGVDVAAHGGRRESGRCHNPSTPGRFRESACRLVNRHAYTARPQQSFANRMGSATPLGPRPPAGYPGLRDDASDFRSPHSRAT